MAPPKITVEDYGITTQSGNKALLQYRVVGNYYTSDMGKWVYDNIYDGDIGWLQYEPYNSYDPHAVVVLACPIINNTVAQSIKIGYIPRGSCFTGSDRTLVKFYRNAGAITVVPMDHADNANKQLPTIITPYEIANDTTVIIDSTCSPIGVNTSVKFPELNRFNADALSSWLTANNIKPGTSILCDVVRNKFLMPRGHNRINE